MFVGIPLSDIRGRPLIEVPKPKRLLDQNGQPMERDRLPVFDVKAASLDFAVGRHSAVKQAFHDRFVINTHSRATQLQLAVFHALAKTTEWAEARIVIGGDNKPVLLSNGNGQAILTTHGNRTATRTIHQLAAEAGASYGAVQKALQFWEELGILTPMPPYERQAIITEHRKAGRPIDFRRYEIDADYVWNGYIWLGTGYKAYTMSDFVVSD